MDRKGRRAFVRHSSLQFSGGGALVEGRLGDFRPIALFSRQHAPFRFASLVKLFWRINFWHVYTGKFRRLSGGRTFPRKRNFRKGNKLKKRRFPSPSSGATRRRASFPKLEPSSNEWTSRCAAPPFRVTLFTFFGM